MAAATGSPGTTGPVFLRVTLWLLLGGWIGAWLCFALIVAQISFEVLPSELAGQLVARVLATLHWYGAVAGLALTAIAWALGRGPLAIGLPLVLALGCLVNQVGVTPQIAALRDLGVGPGGDAQVLERFQALHRLSMGIFSGVLLGAIWLLVLHARRDALPDRIP